MGRFRYIKFDERDTSKCECVCGGECICIAQYIPYLSEEVCMSVCMGGGRRGGQVGGGGGGGQGAWQGVPSLHRDFFRQMVHYCKPGTRDCVLNQ